LGPGRSLRWHKNKDYIGSVENYWPLGSEV